MAVRLALLRSVRRSVFARVSICQLHARALPSTTPKKLMAEFKKAAVDEGNFSFRTVEFIHIAVVSGARYDGNPESFPVYESLL